jgi:hypothetical protein
VKIKALTNLITLGFLCAVIISLSAKIQAQPGGSSAREIKTEGQKTDPRVDQIIERASDHFRKGKLSLQNNKPEQARDEFDKAVDVILEANLDVRTNKQLEAFYLELVEKIYREEVSARQKKPRNSALAVSQNTDILHLPAPPQFRSSYDRFENRTLVWVPYDRVYVKNLEYQNLSVAAYFSYHGKAPNTPVEKMGLLFTSIAKELTYLKRNELIAIVDGQRLPLGRPVLKDFDVSSTYGVKIEEVLGFEVEFSALKKMAYARRVEMRLGSAEFDLHSSFLRSLQALLSGITAPPVNAKKRSTK